MSEKPVAISHDSHLPIVDDLGDAVQANAPFAAPASRIRHDGDTEDLLNGMIAEMHYLMREVVMPSACRTQCAQTRQNFLGEAMAFATTSAKLATAIAGLRIADRSAPQQPPVVIEARPVKKKS